MTITHSERLTINSLLPSNRTECSPAALSRRLLEGPLNFAEIVELSERCDLRIPAKRTANRGDNPFTFVFPSVQVAASISRFVE
jgi:hypothetical protein